MDFTGITDLQILSTDNLDILFIGDNHSMYDPYRDNVMHNWVNTEITQKPNSYAIAEHSKLDSQICFPMHLFPRYFNHNRIYQCDAVRYSIHSGEYATKETVIEINKFINKIRNSTDILQLLPPFRDNENNKILSDLSKTNEIYTMDNGSIRAKNHLYIKEDISQKNITTLNMLYNYESMELHYLHYSMIYRVINWMKDYYKKGTLPADRKLWKIVNSWVDPNKFVDCEIVTFAHILDIAMITKILDLSRKHSTEKILLWVVAGGAHTDAIYNFLRKLFEFMGNTTAHYIKNLKNLNIKSNAMLDIIKTSPHLGLREPAPYVEKRYMTGEQLVELMKSMNFSDTPESNSKSEAESKSGADSDSEYDSESDAESKSDSESKKIKRFIDTVLDDKFIAAYPAATKALPVIKSDLKKIKDIRVIIKLIELMQDKQIVKHFLLEEIKTLFAIPRILVKSKKSSTLTLLSLFTETSRYQTYIEGTGGKYRPSTYKMFSEPIKCIFIPYFTRHEVTRIIEKSVCMESYINAKNNVKFDELKAGTSILSIPTNNNTAYESTEDYSDDIDLKYNKFIELITPMKSTQSTVSLIIENMKKSMGSPNLKQDLIGKGYLKFSSALTDDNIRKYINRTITKEAEEIEKAEKVQYGITYYRKMWDDYLDTITKLFIDNKADKDLVLHAHRRTLIDYDEYPITQNEEPSKLDQATIEQIHYMFVAHVSEHKLNYIKQQIKNSSHKDISDDVKYFICENEKELTTFVNIEIKDMFEPDKIEGYFTLPSDESIEYIIDELLIEETQSYENDKSYDSIQNIMNIDETIIKKIDKEYFTLERLICEIEKYLENNKSDDEYDDDDYDDDGSEWRYGGADTTCKWLDVLLLAILICVFLYLFYQVGRFIVGHKCTAKRYTPHTYQAV